MKKDVVKRIKQKIKQYKKSNSAVKLLLYNTMLLLYRSILFVFKPRTRNEIISSIVNKNHQNQVITYTKENRYPLLFKIVKEYFEEANINFESLRILSYGCSTGEEVKTINDYMPNAQITGIDINKWCINQAKKRYGNSNFHFTNNFEEIKNKKYDVVFALAVLQHSINALTENNKYAKNFLFGDFEREINKLHKLLKPGGLMVIDQSDFYFLDTALSKNYKVLNVADNSIERDRAYFDTRNIKIGDTFVGYRVFIKKSV